MEAIDAVFRENCKGMLDGRRMTPEKYARSIANCDLVRARIDSLKITHPGEWVGAQDGELYFARNLADLLGQVPAREAASSMLYCQLIGAE